MSFGLELAIKLVVIGALIPVTALVLGYAELKISAHMQSRIGPYFAGGRWGWAQLLADGVKFVQKEDIIPDNADRPVFKVAPVLVMISTATLFVILPFGPGGGFVVRDLNLGIFYALAISSVGTVGVLMASARIQSNPSQPFTSRINLSTVSGLSSPGRSGLARRPLRPRL